MFLILFILFSFQTNALLVKLSDVPTMAKHSDLIVHGYVGDQTVSYDEIGRIITKTQIEIIDGLYGAKTGEIVTLYQVGGKKDGIVMPIVGGQKYIVGEQVILFGLKLENNFVSFGAGQGKFDITEKEVKEDLGNVHSIRKFTTKDEIIYKPEALTFDELNDFKKEIKLMIKGRIK